MDSDESSDDQQGEERTAADMVSSFLLHAPPGELPEVLEAVKGIVRDERLIDEQVTKVVPKYTRSQLTPIKFDGLEHPVILSTFNDIGNNRYVDPRSKKSFQYNHVTGAITDLNDWQPDPNAESWRSALEQEWTSYSAEHYHEGAGSVFSSYKDDTVTLNACLEGHQFQPKKFWNGRWRSVWTISFKPKDKQAELDGRIRLHVHYYEDGNVQLVSSRSCDQKINITKPESVAKDIVESVKKLESDYQRAISENYQTMSDTTFKALRRPLPVIRSKIEWNKLMGYKIGSELKQQ
jgi:capping protein alpha